MATETFDFKSGENKARSLIVGSLGATLLLAGFDKKEVDGARVRQHSVELGPVEEHFLQVRGKPVRAYYTHVVVGYHSIRTP